MFFLASAHLYVVFVQPENIGPYASADRVWTGRFWILYALLLISVHLHAGIGIYRLAMKWYPFTAANSKTMRPRLKVAMWGIIVFFLCLGSVTLVTYMKVGWEHADRAGERYVPSSAANHQVSE
jgi:fumarate reductase subunit C